MAVRRGPRAVLVPIMIIAALFATGLSPSAAVAVPQTGALIGFTKIAAGNGFTCGISVEGRTFCWGRNNKGQLGNGSTVDSAIPVRVQLPSAAREIAVGDSHVCAILVSGAVHCWGDNYFSQLGRSSSTDHYATPIYAAGATDGAESVELGASHSCVRMTDGTTYCWGSDSDSQSGQGGYGSFAMVTYPNMAVAGVSASALAAGARHTCAISSGTVYCWGILMYGVVGPNGGSSWTRTAPSPVVVPGTTGARAISSSVWHTCAIVTGGAVKCWGSNGDGQLGNASTPSGYENDYPKYRATPVSATGITGATSVSAGGNATCVVVAQGAVRCWGANNAGQLGDGTGVGSKVPVSVSGITGATAVSVGYDHACALVQPGGVVRCWGGNGSGQLGDGTTIGTNAPSALPVELAASSVSTGSLNSCAVTATGSVSCWGSNRYGQLGVGTTDLDLHRPVTVPGLSGVASVSVGGEHSCALLLAGTVKCWGHNNRGQLGVGTIVDSRTPVLVPGLTGVVALASGVWHTCAVLGGGTMKCWGRNNYGQLGDGSLIDRKSPVAVSGLTGATKIAAGFGHTCALVAGGAAKCWGYNGEGELGTGNVQHCYTSSPGMPPECYTGAKPNSKVPAAVEGLTGATQIASGDTHVCVVVAGGAVRCWGNDDDNELGSSTSSSQSATPVAVPGVTGIVSLGLMQGTSCGSRADGQVTCWGTGGWFANGVAAPHLQAGLTGVRSLSGGPNHICALLTTGAVRCWGPNYAGQTGNIMLTELSTYFLFPSIRQ